MNRIIHIIQHSARAAATLLLTVLTAATAWAETKTVSYIDADGNTQTVTATVLKSTYSVDDPEGFVGELEAGWYVVSTSFSYTSQVHTPTEGNTGTIHIILADGAEMSVQNNSGGNAIYLGNQYPLAIYGQSAGTGRLTVTCESDVTAIYANGGFTINGGIVTATGKGTYRSGIYANQDFTINGGQLTATGPSYYGISAETITLGGGTITANGGSGGYNGTVSIALPDGYVYSDGTNTYANSTLTDAQKTAIASKTLTTTPDPAHFSQSGDTYTIHTAGGWNVFCDLLNQNAKGFFTDKTIVLGTDITVSRMAGGSYHDFTGTFDGGGHTLTVNYGSASSPIDEDKAAPFRNVETGCVIENLNVSGDIYASQKYAGGLVGTQYGAVTIRNCHVSTVIHSLTSGDGTHGGIVGNIGNSSSTSLTIEGCLFDGKLLSYGETATNSCGGLVGYKGNNASATITNSLYAPAALAEDETEISAGATFVRNGSVGSNCYYTRVLGDAQGKAPRTVTAGDEYTTVAVALTGTTTQYTVSGITAYSGGGLQRGETFYYGEGDPVTLTLSNTASAAPLGYQYGGYTASAGTLSGNDTDGYTLTMPDTDVTISLGALRSDGQPHEVAYTTADGATETAQAIALDGHETRTSDYGTDNVDLAAGTYYVGTDINYTNVKMRPQGNITLILADGCTMHLGTEDNPTNVTGIEKISDLTIYGQSLDAATAGTISYVGTGGKGFYVGNYTQHSGNVSISNSPYTGGGGIVANSVTLNGGKLSVATNSKKAIAIYTDGDGGITINGGQLDATATGSDDLCGLYAYDGGTITLGWTNPTDRITASSYYGGYGVKVADGQALTDGSGHYYSGTLGSDEITAIGGQTLAPFTSLNLTANLAPDDNYWTTFYCGNVGFDIEGNACVYTATYASGQLTLHKLGTDGKTIPADCAVIIVGESNEVNLSVNTSAPAYTNDPVNSLRGVDVDTSTSDIQSTLGSGTFYVLGMTTVNEEKHFGFHKYDGTTMAARKAFVLVSGSNAALARSLTIVFDDATGIKALPADSVDAKDGDAWYTLDGRRLQGKPAVSGLYINNGKKIIVK